MLAHEVPLARVYLLGQLRSLLHSDQNGNNQPTTITHPVLTDAHTRKECVSAFWVFMTPYLAYQDDVLLPAPSSDERALWSGNFHLLLALLKLSAQAATGEKDPLCFQSSRSPAEDKHLWAPASSHFAWFAKSVSALHGSVKSSRDVTQEEAWDATANAFLILSCMKDIGTRTENETLYSILNWAMQTRDATYELDSWPSPLHPFFRLQCATLSLVCALMQSAKPGISRERLLARLSTSIEAFAPSLCSLVASPRSRHPLTSVMKEPVFMRDAVFVDILLLMSQSNLAHWMDSMENDVYVRQWVDLLDMRWDVLHEEDNVRRWITIPPRAERLFIQSLLACERIFEASPGSEAYWKQDSVQRVAFSAVRTGWRTTGAEGEQPYPWMKYEVLIKRTLALVLPPTGFDVHNFMKVQWQIDDAQFHINSVAEKQKPPEPMLSQLHDLYRLLLDKKRELWTMNTLQDAV